jgi:hypothetical protein
MAIPITKEEPDAILARLFAAPESGDCKCEGDSLPDFTAVINEAWLSTVMDYPCMDSLDLTLPERRQDDALISFAVGYMAAVLLLATPAGIDRYKILVETAQGEVKARWQTPNIGVAELIEMWTAKYNTLMRRVSCVSAMRLASGGSLSQTSRGTSCRNAGKSLVCGCK